MGRENVLMRPGLSVFTVVAGAVSFAASLGAAHDDAKKPEMTAKSALDFTVKDIDGKDVALSKYKGDVLLIVNVASK